MKVPQRWQSVSPAASVAPATGSLALVDSWAGLRPRAADERPVLGASTEIERLYFETGHYRNGVLLASLTAQLIADWVCEG